MNWRRTSPRGVLIIVVLLSLAAKFLIVELIITKHPERALTNDSIAYLNSSRVLLADGSFGVSTELPGVPQTLLVPGYPVFLMVVSAVFNDHVPWTVRIQGILGALTVLLVFFVGTYFVSPTAGIVSAALLVFDPNFFGISLFALSETLFTLLLFCSASLLYLSLKAESKLVYALLGGFVLGLATLTRPVALYLPPLIFIWYSAASYIDRHPVKTSVTNSAAILAAFAIVVGGWSVRNHAVSGSWSLCQIEGINLLFYRAADVVATEENMSLNEARTRLAGGRDYGELRSAATLNPELRLGDRWRREATGIILNHPVVYARRAILHSMVLLGGPGDGWLARILYASKNRQGPLGDLRRLSAADWRFKWLRERSGQGLLFLYSALYLAFLYGCVVVGAAKIWMTPGKRRFWGLMTLLVLYLVVVSAGPEAYYRFRVPIAPFLCLIGGVGLTFLGRGVFVKSKKTMEPAPPKTAGA